MASGAHLWFGVVQELQIFLSLRSCIGFEEVRGVIVGTLQDPLFHARPPPLAPCVQPATMVIRPKSTETVDYHFGSRDVAQTHVNVLTSFSMV